MDEYLGLKLGHRIKAELFLIADELSISASQLARVALQDCLESTRQRLGTPELYKEIAVKSRRAHDQAA